MSSIALQNQERVSNTQTLETTTLRFQQAREVWEIVEHSGDFDGHICQIVKRSMAVAA